MEKFIAAFDGLKFSKSTLQYAITLSMRSKAHLVGVFLEDFTRRSYSLTEISNYEGKELDKHLSKLDEKDSATREKSVREFVAACEKSGIQFSIHRDQNFAFQELMHESIYADLLLINMNDSLNCLREQAPTNFIQDLLNDVQCPVLVVPNEYRNIEGITIFYDGSSSSVYAARIFSYLFESLNDLQTQVVTVKPELESPELPDSMLIKELIKRHYPKAEYVVLKGDAEDEIVRYLQRQKKENIIVLGSYGRSRISQLFHTSMADVIMQELKKPLFIAHNKG